MDDLVEARKVQEALVTRLIKKGNFGAKYFQMADRILFYRNTCMDLQEHISNITIPEMNHLRNLLGYSISRRQDCFLEILPGHLATKITKRLSDQTRVTAPEEEIFSWVTAEVEKSKERMIQNDGTRSL